MIGGRGASHPSVVRGRTLSPRTHESGFTITAWVRPALGGEPFGDVQSGALTPVAKVGDASRVFTAAASAGLCRRRWQVKRFGFRLCPPEALRGQWWKWSGPTRAVSPRASSARASRSSPSAAGAPSAGRASTPPWRAQTRTWRRRGRGRSCHRRPGVAARHQGRRSGRRPGRRDRALWHRASAGRPD